jgi:Hemerythrin HHE cation binding domain
MTLTEQATSGTFEMVGDDLYKDIHKGIRAELFAVTGAAGHLDPTDRIGRADPASHVGNVIDLLVAHAGHEDAHLQSVLEVHLPEYAPRIAGDHEMLDAWMVGLRARADENVEAVSDLRGRTHALYLDLASFTSAYLAHQDLEEREIMPALEAAIGVEAGSAIHRAIVASIPPPEMAKSLAIMIPAMNIDDRTDLLAGMKAGAPPEVFAGVWGLVRSVLTAGDCAALATRLGV